MIEWIHEKLIRPILTAHDSPQAVASGVAVGVGIAFTPTLGVQMPLALLVTTLCGCNRVVAVAMVWISNPLTALPIYYTEYQMGARVLDRSVMTFQDFSQRWSEMSGFGYFERFKVLINVLTDVAVPLLVGAFVTSIVLGVLSYPLALAFVKRSRELRREGGREPVSPVAGLGRVDSGAQILCLAALLGAGALTACAENGPPGEISGVPDEARAEGRVSVWYSWLDGGLLVTLAPFHVATGQRDYTQDRFSQLLGREDVNDQYLSLEVFSFEPEAPPEALGSDGIRVVAAGSGGRVEAVAPSTLLKDDLDPADRALLSALLGPGALPDLAGGRSLRLLVVMPSDQPLATYREVGLQLPRGEVRLESGLALAGLFEEFQNDPSRSGFGAALVRETASRNGEDETPGADARGDESQE